MLKIITPVGECHKHFLPYLSEKIRKSCARAGIMYNHLIDEDKGFPSMARNRLLENINNDDYVAFIDADDYPCDAWAETISQFFDHDVIYGDYCSYENGDIYRSQRFDYEKFKKVNFIGFSTVAMKGSIARQVRFQPIYYAEDWVFMHEVYKVTQDFYYIPFMITVRRIDTSINRGVIPVYRKLKRLYRIHKVKQIIEKL